MHVVSTSRPQRPPHQLVDVLAQNIRLKIDVVAIATPPQVRDLTGVRNDPNVKPISVDARDSQADSIDGDGALLDDVAHDRLRRFHVEHVILALALELTDLSAPVDVTEHEVPIEPRICVEDARGSRANPAVQIPDLFAQEFH